MNLLEEHVSRLLRERDRLVEQVLRLQAALRDAIRDTSRVTRRAVEAGPAGNTYEFDWKDRVREWAGLCHLDLAGMDPAAYEPFP